MARQVVWLFSPINVLLYQIILNRKEHFNKQNRRNSRVLTMESRIFYIKQSIWQNLSCKWRTSDDHLSLASNRDNGHAMPMEDICYWQ